MRIFMSRNYAMQGYKLNLGLLRVVEMSQRADTGGTGANDQEETTAFESRTQVKNLVVNAVKECHNGRQYCNCKRYSSLTRVPALSSQL